ncbi:MAG: hypothetical protein O3A92_05835 [Verrucomicrobia bacterium]|nr:hypothetical protein [Verrucomicrobiota bacterium]
MSRAALRFLVFALCIVHPGCHVSSSIADKEAAERNGSISMPIAKEFADVFPNAFHWIGYYNGTKGDPRWNSQVGVHDRYVLSMEFEIEFDPTRTTPTRKGPPKFLLLEVSEIDETIGGGASVGYTQNQIAFGIDEWSRLRDSGGDLSALGFEVIRDQPIVGFEKALQNR